MSHSKRKKIPWLTDRAGKRKNHKRLTHKILRARVKQAIKKGQYELLEYEWVGKELPLDYWFYDYDVYIDKESMKKSGYTDAEIKKLFSK